MTSKIILPGAWELTQDVSCDLFSLQVPTKWQQVAKTFAQTRVRLQGKGYPSVPVYSLDRIITASFPSIIQTARHGWQRPGFPWIFATEMADLSNLAECVKDWLREEFSSCLGEEFVKSGLDQLDDDWHWEDPKNYPLLHPPENKYEADVRFQAIPDYLAKKFLEAPTVCFKGNNAEYQLTFYRVVTLESGAELMSWPPYPIPLTKKGKQEPGEAFISFVIRFKLQTVPWRSQPMIYHQLSIRRWITEPFDKFPYPGATIHIGDNRRWLDGIHQPFCFMPLQVKRRNTPEGYQPSWSKAISELLKINDSPLPAPNDLASAPTYNWPQFGETPVGMQGAIAYHTAHTGDAPCLPGVSPLDLDSLDQAIQERLPLVRVGKALRVKVPKAKKVKTEQQKQPNFWELTGTLKTAMLRSEIAAPATFRIAQNSPYTILILWETQDCRDALITEILRLLELSPQAEAQTDQNLTEFKEKDILCQTLSGFLRIRTQHVQDLTQKLNLDDSSVKGKSKQQKRVKLIEERIQKIIAYLPQPKGLSGALIEIKPKKFFFPRESDPKLALRIGAMQAGYINQYINPLKALNKKGEEYTTTDASNRVQRAVSDLLRQFGILPTPLIDPQKDGVDSNLWLTCFYVLRRTRKTTVRNIPLTVALMVRVNPVLGIVEVTTPSLFYNPTSPNWVSYPAALKHLIDEKWDSDSCFDETTSDSNEEESFSKKEHEQNLLNQFVADCLRDCLKTPIEVEKEPPRVLLMAEAQNARKMLTWLQNPKLPANGLPQELTRGMKQSEINRLWVVRLRDANNGEVPVGIVENSPGSRASGVFRWQGVCGDGKSSLYLSIRKPLNTEQGTNTLQVKQSRLDDGSLQAGNRRLLEIAIVHCPDIESDKLVGSVHRLRERWPYFADEVALPLPFPFAILAKEYAVGAKDAVESEEAEESLD